MRLKSKWISALLCVSLAQLNLVSAAFAQDSAQQVEELSKEATKRYRAKDFAGAVELFKKAYDIEPVPNLLFNIAKCYEKLEDWPAAIEYYEKFVVQPDIDTHARQSALDRAKALREVIAAEEETKRLAEKKTPTGTVEKSNTTAEPQADYTWAWITTTSGVVLLSGGAVLGVLASTEQKNFDDGATYDDRKAAKDAGETYALAADGLFITGGILTLVGVLLFVTGGSDESDVATQQGVQPYGWVGPAGGGLGMSGAF